MRTTILTAGICSITLLLVSCGGSSGDGDSVDSSKSVGSIDLASAEELESVDQTYTATERSVDAAMTVQDQAFGATISAQQMIKKLNLQGMAQELASESTTLDTVTIDTNLDSTDDLQMGGSAKITWSGDDSNGSAKAEMDIDAQYIADATFTDGDESYTINTGSAMALDATMNIDIVNSVASFSVDIESRLKGFSVDWSEGADSGSSSLSGRFELWANNLTESQLDSSFSGNFELYVEGTVSVNGTGHDVAIDGSGTFNAAGDDVGITGNYYVSIDGTVYGPFTEEELEDVPVAAQ